MKLSQTLRHPLGGGIGPRHGHLDFHSPNGQAFLADSARWQYHERFTRRARHTNHSGDSQPPPIGLTYGTRLVTKVGRLIRRFQADTGENLAIASVQGGGPGIPRIPIISFPPLSYAFCPYCPPHQRTARQNPTRFVHPSSTSALLNQRGASSRVDKTHRVKSPRIVFAFCGTKRTIRRAASTKLLGRHPQAPSAPLQSACRRG